MASKSSDRQNVHRDIPLDPVIALKNVRLSEVDLTDNTFRITTRSDPDKLVLSIEKLGLMHPPMLKYSSPGYVVVCGFRRIAACLNLGWTRVPARIFEQNVGRFELAQMAIADNALQRPLNLLETSRAIRLLADVCADQKQLRKASLELGLPHSPPEAAKIKQICGLPLKVQEGILGGTITMSMALELGRLDPAVAARLIDLFSHLKVGLNKQRELLLLFTEIAEREDIAILQLIAEKPLQKILNNTEMDRALKRQKVRSYLRQRRFPAITKAETDYRKWRKQLKLGENINLIPPKDFEGNTFSMKLSFNNRQDFSNLIKRIEKIIQHPALSKILD
ncbi:MAG: ParB/RepB/Spo0J family partition protein [Desulfobacterales bacterium]|jgi:ParB family chromosome partitioning protein